MTKEEKKYVLNACYMIEAVVKGTLMGAYMFGMDDSSRSMGEKIRSASDKAMLQISKDVLRVYRHGKRVGKKSR